MSHALGPLYHFILYSFICSFLAYFTSFEKKEACEITLLSVRLSFSMRLVLYQIKVRGNFFPELAVPSPHLFSWFSPLPNRTT
jgi:hypothetical protein